MHDQLLIVNDHALVCVVRSDYEGETRWQLVRIEPDNPDTCAAVVVGSYATVDEALTYARVNWGT